MAERQNMSKGDSIKPCDPCTYRKIQKDAGIYCQDCDEYLCGSCEEFHKSLKLTRNHHLKSLADESKQREQISVAAMTCEVHTADDLTLVCLDHNVPTCDRCKITKHRKCNTQKLDEIEVEAKTKRDLAQIVEKTKALISELKAIQKARVQDKEKVQHCSEAFKFEIKNIKGKIIAWAEKLERKMEKHLDDTERELMAGIEAHEKMAGETITQLKGVSHTFGQLGSDARQDESLVVRIRGQTRFNEGKQIKREILKEIKPVTFQFCQSDKLVRLMMEIKSLGTLNIGVVGKNHAGFLKACL